MANTAQRHEAAAHKCLKMFSPIKNKIVVSGVKKGIKKSDILHYCSKFGEIIKVEKSGAEGTQFVEFLNEESVSRILNTPEAQHLVKKHVPVTIRLAHTRLGLLFVQNLRPEFSTERLLEVFQLYGQVLKLEREFGRASYLDSTECYVIYNNCADLSKINTNLIMIDNHPVFLEKVDLLKFQEGSKRNFSVGKNTGSCQ